MIPSEVNHVPPAGVKPSLPSVPSPGALSSNSSFRAFAICQRTAPGAFLEGWPHPSPGSCFPPGRPGGSRSAAPLHCSSPYLCRGRRSPRPPQNGVSGLADHKDVFGSGPTIGRAPAPPRT